MKAQLEQSRRKLATQNKQGGRIREIERCFDKEYPVNVKFKTKLELEEYFATPRIVCLLCGRKLHTLAKHLTSIHGVTADQYKEKYGIPWSYGLNSPSTANNQSKALKARIAKGDTSLSTAVKGEIKTIGSRFHRPKCDATRHENFKKLAMLNDRVHANEDGSTYSEGCSEQSYLKRLAKQKQNRAFVAAIK